MAESAQLKLDNGTTIDLPVVVITASGCGSIGSWAIQATPEVNSAAARQAPKVFAMLLNMV